MPATGEETDFASRREAGLSTRRSSMIWRATANAGLYNGLTIRAAFTGAGSGAGDTPTTKANGAAGSGTVSSGYISSGMAKAMSRQEMLASLEEFSMYINTLMLSMNASQISR